MTQNQPGSGPTVLRILLGSQLRRLREGKGITREDAGHPIRASESKISRMELGRVSFKERDVTDLLDALRRRRRRGARSRWWTLAGQANSPGWWHKYGDVLPDWFQVYVGLEEAASLSASMRCSSCPACCRRRTTPARSSARRSRRGAGGDRPPGQPAMERQQLLTKPDGPGCGRSWTRRRCAAPSAGRR